MTGFAQFESAVLGNAVNEAADPTAFTFQATVDDGQSHTLLATVTQAGAAAADPMTHGEPGMVFLANGAFGIVDKKVDVIGDGQLIDFARKHGTVNMVDLDADKATHVQGNTLVMDATDVRLMSDVGSAMSLGSALLDASFRPVSYTHLDVYKRQGDNQVTLHGKLASPLLLAQERVTIYVKAEDASLFTPIGVATIANGTDWSFSLPQRNGDVYKRQERPRGRAARRRCVGCGRGHAERRGRPGMSRLIIDPAGRDAGGALSQILPADGWDGLSLATPPRRARWCMRAMFAGLCEMCIRDRCSRSRATK